MENASKTIALHVENGNYFIEARNWYINKYVWPQVERMQLCISTILMLCAVYLICNMTLDDYQTTPYPFPLYAENQDLLFHRIVKISHGTEDPNISYLRYFITRYVLLREDYGPEILNKEGWANTLRKVRALSSRSAFAAFVKTMDASQNPNSPMLQYRLARRSIKITDIKFDQHTDIPSSAVVYFVSHDSASSGEKNSASWEAHVQFSFSNINRVTKQKTRLQFIVTKYNLKRVK